jgi:carbonyl reductase 1
MVKEAERWWSKDTVAVVTGANKGIGFEIVRQLAKEGITVVLTARDATRGEKALESLKSQGLHNVNFHPLDVTSQESILALANWLRETYGGIDILINNAGILLIGIDTTFETVKPVFDTNYFGVKNVTKALLPLLRDDTPGGARVIVVASRAGQLTVTCLGILVPQQPLNDPLLCT